MLGTTFWRPVCRYAGYYTMQFENTSNFVLKLFFSLGIFKEGRQAGRKEREGRREEERTENMQARARMQNRKHRNGNINPASWLLYLHTSDHLFSTPLSTFSQGHTFAFTFNNS